MQAVSKEVRALLQRSKDASFISAVTNNEPDRAMLMARATSVYLTTIFYALRNDSVKDMTADMISGGNEIMPTLATLTIAWSPAAVSQKRGLNAFIQQHVGTSLPAWCVAVTIFTISAAVTYFIGSSWHAASLIMPSAIILAVSAGARIPLCVAAVITGGTFGDLTAPVGG